MWGCGAVQKTDRWKCGHDIGLGSFAILVHALLGANASGKFANLQYVATANSVICKYAHSDFFLRRAAAIHRQQLARV
jgi:hypothetical protein